MTGSSQYIYVLPLLLITIFGLSLAIFLARHLSNKRAQALLIIILGACVWSFGYAMEFSAPDLASKLVWARIQYFGILTLPLAWLIFTFQLIGLGGQVLRPAAFHPLLGIIPLLTLALVFTNDFHHLVWSRVALLTQGNLQILVLQHGAWFWVYVAYGYVLLTWGSARLIGGVLRSLNLRQWQVWVTVLGAFIPWIANLLYVAGHSPIPNLDLTPFSFMISGLLFAVSLFRFHLVDILPIAREEVVKGLADCVIILDANNLVVDLNPSAARKLISPDIKPLGKPLAQVDADLAAAVAAADRDKLERIEISRGDEAHHQYFELRLSAILGPYPWPVGRLIVCHEITELKLEHARLERMIAERTEALRRSITQLEQSRRELRSLALRLQDVQELERRRIAGELHDQVGQNLTALNLGLELIHQQVGNGSGAEVLKRLESAQKQVEETTHLVRNLMADLHPTILDEAGLLPALRWYCEQFTYSTGIPAQVFGDGAEPRLPRNTEMVVFRIVQEALHNAAKHSKATRIGVFAESTPEELTLRILDDGQGFDLRKLERADGQPHWGIINMRQRADSIGAALSINSTPGGGAQVVITLQRGKAND